MPESCDAEAALAMIRARLEGLLADAARMAEAARGSPVSWSTAAIRDALRELLAEPALGRAWAEQARRAITLADAVVARRAVLETARPTHAQVAAFTAARAEVEAALAAYRAVTGGPAATGGSDAG